MFRADAGSDTGVLGGLAARNLGFLVSGSICDQLVRALRGVKEGDWQAAIPSVDHRRLCDPPDGDLRVSAVCEITHLVDPIGHLPSGTRVILRREKLHPGAQMRLWDDIWRYQVVYTNLPGDPVELEYRHRLRARCEQQMTIFKDAGAGSWPFASFQGNTNWFHLALLAHTLLSWVAHAGFVGHMAKVRPKPSATASWRLPAGSCGTAAKTSCGSPAPRRGGPTSWAPTGVSGSPDPNSKRPSQHGLRRPNAPANR